MKKLILIAALTGLCCGWQARAERKADGETVRFELPSSRVYPGTSRTLTVWIPDAYDGATPACLLVRMDSMGPVPEVLSELISEKAIPVTAAVIIEPGKIFKPGTRKVIRYNRSNEFDRTDGRFAGFLENEVLPALGSVRTSDGRSLTISPRATDHAIMGYSSGKGRVDPVLNGNPDIFSHI